MYLYCKVLPILLYDMINIMLLNEVLSSGLDENTIKGAFYHVCGCKMLLYHIQVHLNKLECRGKVHLFQ